MQRQLQDPEFKLDIERDESILPLIKPAIEQGVPFFAICRGFQELNVAFGGSLHARLDLVGNYSGHAEDTNLPLELRYDEAHKVDLVAGGILNKMLEVDSINVNSLHTQGIDQLGENLIPEAYAEDGLVEAVAVEGSKNFAIGVQWHPEWHSTENPVSTRIFSEFGKACYAFADRNS